MYDGKRGDARLAADLLAVQEALDSLPIGLSVFDATLHLVTCNRTFIQMLDYPPELACPGTPLEAFIRLNVERGNYGKGNVEDLVQQRLAEAHKFEAQCFRQTLADGTIIEVVRRPLPSGGLVATYTDVTEITHAREALETKEAELMRHVQDIGMERQMVERQAQQMVQMAEDLALRNKEIEKSRDESDFQAKHDELTGLPNRRFFTDYLEQVLGVAGPVGAHKALLFVDLDNFKPVNDVLGHDHGDRLLRRVALRLTSSVRDSDFVARLGGDEFAIIAAVKPENGIGGVRVLADRILKALSMTVDEAEQPIAVAASIGVALFPGDGGNRAALLRAADEAMYEAKHQGRNRVLFACEMEDA